MVMTMVFQVYLTEYLNENAILRTEMQKSEKLNIVSELAASVAHEFEIHSLLFVVLFNC